MKNKKTLNTGVNIIGISLVLTLIETIVFLFIDGWHFKPTHPTEILLDKILSYGLSLGMIISGYAMMNYVMDKINEEE